jgi:NTP pyrophosphatase (non-canonical NTP hydrolase)
MSNFTLDVYQKLANRTAKYPKNLATLYLALGVAGEGGELANKVKKFLRLGLDPQDLAPEHKAVLTDELGDILWYIALLALELGVPLSEIAKENLIKLNQRALQGDIKSMEHGQGG